MITSQACARPIVTPVYNSRKLIKGTLDQHISAEHFKESEKDDRVSDHH